MRAISASFGIILLLGSLGSARAAEINIEQGRRIARDLCAGCHSVERTGDSPMPIAPPFRELYQRLPVSRLAESFRQGLPGAHQSMPRFRFDPDQIENLIAYIEALH
jgi:cytochrome c